MKNRFLMVYQNNTHIVHVTHNFTGMANSLPPPNPQGVYSTSSGQQPPPPPPQQQYIGAPPPQGQQYHQGGPPAPPQQTHQPPPPAQLEGELISFD